MARTNVEVGCPVAATLNYIGGRWKTVILYFLSSGERRFGEIAVRIPGISKKVLSQQLKELERDGLISRKQTHQFPSQVGYTLTNLGESLSPVFREMSIWGKKNVLAKRIAGN